MAQMKDKFPVEYDEIRQTIIDVIEEKMQSENPDLYESGFIAIFSDALAVLSLDNLFYSSMNYKEAFLTQAVLPESVLNIARQLSYQVPNASPSTVDVLISLPFMQNGVRLWDKLAFTLEKMTRFGASGTQFLLEYDVFFDFNYDTLLGNFKNELYKQTDTAIAKIPYAFLELNPDVNDPTYTETYLQFFVTCTQYVIQEYSFKAPRVEPLRFHSIDVPFTDQVYKTEVSIKEDGDSDFIPWTQYENVFTMPYGALGYAATVFSEYTTFSFGNGIYGKIPRANADIKIMVYETKGKEGKVVADSVNIIERIYDTYSGDLITMFVTNPTVSSDGVNRETIEETRINAKDWARAVNGLVSEKNYSNLGAILKIPLQATLAIIKRSDIHSNEIFTYIASKFSDTELVPTRSDTVTFDNGVLQPIIIDGKTYVCPFEITPDISTSSLFYRYVVTDFIGTADLVSTQPEAKDYAVVFNQVRCLYDELTSKFTVKVYYDYIAKDPSGAEDPTFASKLSMTATMGTTTYIATNDTGNSLFEFEVDRGDVEDGITIFTLVLSHLTTQLKTYKTSFIMTQNLNALIVSTSEDKGGGIIDGYDVPLVEEPFYLANRSWIDINMLQQMSIFADTVGQYRMLTDQVYLKFANTIGKIKNIEYNSLNPHPVKTYVSPNFPIRVEIALRVYIKSENSSSADALIRNIKSTLYQYYLPKFDFEINIYTSEIVKVVQGVPGVEFCDVIKPSDHIVYDYRREDLSKQQMVEFVPEYLWFNEDDISIEIVVD